MKKNVFLIMLTLFASTMIAENVEASLVITNVQPNAGSLFVTFFSSPEALKNKEPTKKIKLNTNEETMAAQIFLPEGEYFVSAFQDVNDNGKFDTNFIGFPREPVGISNYNGSGMPGGFEKQKIPIDADNLVVTIYMNRKKK